MSTVITQMFTARHYIEYDYEDFSDFTKKLIGESVIKHRKGR